MAAVLGRTEIGVRKTGQTVTVPDDPQAKLMYYLKCICCLLDMKDQQDLARLSNYKSYYLLTEAETDALVALCFLLSPDELNGKVIFQNDALCGYKENQFLELSAVQSNLLVSDSILIGGQRRAVHKIMAFKRSWLQTYWIEPMRHFALRLACLATCQRTEAPRPAITYQNQQPPRVSRQTSRDDCNCCIIL